MRFNEKFDEQSVDSFFDRLKSSLRKNKHVSTKIGNGLINLVEKNRTKKTASIKNEPRLDVKGVVPRKKAKAPDLKDFEIFEEKNSAIGRGIVDVLLPVYRGFDETLRCIYSVLSAKTEIQFELVVINDKSPEEDLTKALRELADRNIFTYLENDKNLGFLKTMNKAMLLHEDRDMVWLNSDTEVFDFWLDRIISIANKDEKIATVTPLSNNATINSFPRTLTDNYSELILEDEVIDKIAGKINKDVWVEVPTGVGFCMFVKREALKKTGLLDEAFNLGYGEENDLCQRFIGEGFVNVATPSVFVRHYGSVSFKEKATGLCRENIKILKEKHPTYQAQVEEFIKSDLLKAGRIRLEAAIWSNLYGFDRTVLHILHRRGGGTSKFVLDLGKELRKLNVGSIVLTPGRHGEELSSNIDKENFPNLGGFDLKNGPLELMALIEGLGCENIHVHSLVDVNPALLIPSLEKIKESKGNISVTVTVHDFHCCCSKINLFRSEKEICNNIDELKCYSCANDITGSAFFNRYYAEKLFGISDEITVPSRDVGARLNQVFGSAAFDVVKHFETENKQISIPRINKRRFEIVGIGAIGKEKGRSVLEGLAKYIKDEGLCARVSVIGYLDKKDTDIYCTGQYKSDELEEKLRTIQPDILFQSSIVPETFSYTLTEMLSTNIPVCCFDIGAQAERLKDIGLQANLLDLDLKDDPEELYKAIKAIADKKEVSHEHTKKFDLKEYYKNI